jgi:ferric-dicitrate binding protein FerR (iron transport regulator)
MTETTSHNGASYKLTRLPSALEASKAANRIRPWMSRSEEQQRAIERIARVRRESGIPSPDEWMW